MGPNISEPKTGTFTKKSCERCHVNFNHVTFYKGRYLCRVCFKKEGHIIMFHPNNFKLRITPEEALNKVYKVKGYINPNGRRSTHTSIPPCLIGKYFKIVLVDEKDVPKEYRFKKIKKAGKLQEVDYG